MVTLAAMRRGFHFAQQRVHFFGVEAASRADRHVAGERAGDFFKPLFQRKRIAGFGDVIGEIAHKAFEIGFAEHRGHFAHHHGIRAEGFDDKAQFRQLTRARGDAVHLGGIEFHHFGNEQRLARDAAFGQRGLHALIDKTFMRRVLIDNDDAIRRLRHNIGFM